MNGLADGHVVEQVYRMRIVFVKEGMSFEIAER